MSTKRYMWEVKTHHGLVSKQEDPQNWFVFLMHIYSHPKKHSTRGFGPAGQEPDIHVPQRQAPRYGQVFNTRSQVATQAKTCLGDQRIVLFSLSVCSGLRDKWRDGPLHDKKAGVVITTKIDRLTEPHMSFFKHIGAKQTNRVAFR